MKKDEIIQKCFDRKIDDVIRESTLFTTSCLGCF